MSQRPVPTREHQIRSIQSLLISKAALIVTEMVTMSVSDIHLEMEKKYCKIVTDWTDSGHLEHSHQELWGNTVSDRKVPQKMNGDSLWKRWSSIKKYMNNTLIKTYYEFCGPDGFPPSGKTQDDVFALTLAKLYTIKQGDLAAERVANFRRQRSGMEPPESIYAVKLYDEATCLPPWEWLTFLELGPTSTAPAACFNIRNGGVTMTSSDSRKKQRIGMLSPTSTLSSDSSKSSASSASSSALSGLAESHSSIARELERSRRIDALKFLIENCPDRKTEAQQKLMDMCLEEL
jgi:hypothetical protein